MVALAEVISVLESDRSKIVGLYSGRLRNAIGARADAEDLYQAVAMKAVVGLPNCQAKSLDELRGWIMSIARNTCMTLIETHRAQKRSVKREVDGESVGSVFISGGTLVDPADLLDEPDQCRMVLDGLKYLCKSHADIIRMRFIESLSHQEIALKMNSKPSRVRSVLSRAIRKLKKIVENGRHGW